MRARACLLVSLAALVLALSEARAEEPEESTALSLSLIAGYPHFYGVDAAVNIWRFSPYVRISTWLPMDEATLVLGGVRARLVTIESVSVSLFGEAGRVVEDPENSRWVGNAGGELAFHFDQMTSLFIEVGVGWNYDTRMYVERTNPVPLVLVGWTTRFASTPRQAGY